MTHWCVGRIYHDASYTYIAPKNHKEILILIFNTPEAAHVIWLINMHIGLIHSKMLWIGNHEKLGVKGAREGTAWCLHRGCRSEGERIKWRTWLQWDLGRKGTGTGSGHQQNYDKMRMEWTDDSNARSSADGWSLCSGNWEGIEQGGQAIIMCLYYSTLEYLAHSLGSSKCSVNAGKMNEWVSDWISEWGYAEG